jgi:hypothetical protein
MKPTVKYDLEAIKDEARQLVRQGLVNSQQPIYVLCKYIPAREWECVELELEENDYLLRDRIIDLLNCERWDED